MGSLLRGRILLLKFLCTTGVLGPAIVSVEGGLEDIKTLQNRDDSGPRIS
ncbi:MAG: hypothetical protein ACRD20_12220 [Terriglobales bacterium]